MLISAIYGGETALSTGRIEHLVVHGASCNQPEGLEMTLGVGDPGLSCTAVPSDDTMSRAPARCSATIRRFSVFWENSLPRVSPSRGFSQFFFTKKGANWEILAKLEKSSLVNIKTLIDLSDVFFLGTRAAAYLHKTVVNLVSFFRAVPILLRWGTYTYDSSRDVGCACGLRPYWMRGAQRGRLFYWLFCLPVVLTGRCV